MSLLGAAFAFVKNAIGGYVQNQADLDALSANEKALRRSWLGEDLNASDALERGGAAAGRARMRATTTLAEQQVAFTANGIESTSGTALDLAASSALVGELNATTERNNGIREALGHRKASDAFHQKWEQIASEYLAKQDARTAEAFFDLANVIVEGVSMGMKES